MSSVGWWLFWAQLKALNKVATLIDRPLFLLSTYLTAPQFLLASKVALLKESVHRDRKETGGCQGLVCWGGRS